MAWSGSEQAVPDFAKVADKTRSLKDNAPVDHGADARLTRGL
jgi:hypothetical protein